VAVATEAEASVTEGGTEALATEEEVIMEEASGTEEVTEAMQPDAISAQPNLPLVPNLTYS